ncbi:protein-tyrosine phosphatase family protein [Brevundimonas sp.]|jgi:protein-tyrosine phosphatase|uniref:protein-tyrosine phosphatase family protein n=1 Tax=Brevundimonas sp. TaxID=1871086 RepID=UPI003782EE29
MASDLYWINTSTTLRLAIMARPRSGDWMEDEVDNWKREGVGVVISLLEPDEIEDLGLEGEAALCASRSIQFVSYPIPDRGVPSNKVTAVQLADQIRSSGKATAIHCRAGIGRSALIAALVLRLDGLDGEAAFNLISKARGTSVPDTATQREWIDAVPLIIPTL